jgi:hypothetical protein
VVVVVVGPLTSRLPLAAQQQRAVALVQRQTWALRMMPGRYELM